MEGFVYPALYEAADRSAISEQRHFLVTLGVYLALLVAAALLSLVAQPNRWSYLAQGFTLLGSLGAAVYLAHFKPQKLWYATRALAESIKTLSWRYVMRAEPFDSRESRELFISSLRKVLETNREAASICILMSADQVSVSMDHIRGLPIAQRKEIYLAGRIQDQLNWYTREAGKNKRRSKQWLGLLIAANATAVICAFSQAASPDLAWPTELFVAMAAAGMTWFQARRYQEISASYALTAHEISFIKLDLMVVQSESELSSFVGDAENAFSREHTQWQARKDGA